MVKATAISLLQNYRDASIITVLRESLSDPDPLIRFAAVSALFAADDNVLLELALPSLSDSIRLIRITAAFQLARVPEQYFGKVGLQQRDKVLKEYVATQMINADHPSAHMNLGILALNRGDYAGAESFYKEAIEIEPAMTTAYVNLADLYRVLQRDQDGEKILREAIERGPAMEPGNARYAYVYGVGLNSTGNKQEAVDHLETALRENRFDRDLLYSLSTFNFELGNRAEAIEYAEKLIEYYPADQNYQQLIQAIRNSPN